MQRRFRQVDVFGTTPGSGNPVAVVLDADGLSEDELRRFSVWTNLSECTFVLPPTVTGADYRVRIFSLSTELPFAGHPTLGTARAWLDAGGEPATPGILLQQCDGGLIPVRTGTDELAFVSPPRTRSGPVAPDLLEEIITILGVNRRQVLDSEWLDNGPGWVGLLLDGADTVLGLQPDTSMHPGKWDIGVVGAYPRGAASDFEVRAFFTDGTEPLREDPVTGSLNASVAEWLISTGMAKAPYSATQGSAIGRRGRVQINQDREERLWIGGRADVVVSGFVSL